MREPSIIGTAGLQRGFHLILLLAMAVLFSAGWSAPAGAVEARFLAKEDVIFYGMMLKVEPAKQTVPKNIATIVSAYLKVPTLPSGEIPPLPADATVKGTLRGPGLERPLDLQATANAPLNIPPLSAPGTYSLDNIRVESGGAVLLRGTPESVTIEVIDQLLVTQVTARPLTSQEIIEKGIVYDKSNFQAYNFTAAFAVKPGETVQMDLPVLLPRLATTQDVSVPAVGQNSLPQPQLQSIATIIPDSLKLAQTAIPNLTVSGFSLKMDKTEANNFVVPPIPGVVVIPGDIAFLNQYFDVKLMVGNAAPVGSNLVVKDLKAQIFLPAGNDKVVNTSDDPLSMAMTESGESPRLQAVVQPGPDGKIGTADDIVSLAPGETGAAEFLVEGRREGSHTVEMEITATLYGLPIGPVTVRGRAAGTVLVRNPTFTMTFTHPDVVNAGEEYSLDVTVTNTSASPANFVSISLNPNQIGGAALVDPGKASREIETIPPGDSVSVSFDLRSQISGKVFAATLDSDQNIAGRFQLKTSVGELGIPLSPDSLVLPTQSRSLPKSLRDAALGMLGKAYAVASAPTAALPKGITRFSKEIVWTRGIETAQAGFRYTLHEPLADTARELLFDFMGSNYPRLAEQYPKPADLTFRQGDFSGFDELRRKSLRGDILAATVADLLKDDFLLKGGSEFQRDFAAKTAYRAPHISVVVDGGGTLPPVSLSLTDPAGKVLGGSDDSGKIVKEIPYSDYLVLKDGGDTKGEMAIVSLPSAGAHTISLRARPGADAGTPFNLSVIAPDGAGVLQQVTFVGLTVQSQPVITLPDGSPASFSVQMPLVGGQAPAEPVPNGALRALAAQQPGTVRPVPVPPPAVLSVVQQPDADIIANDCGTWRFGRVVAALFSEEVTPSSAQDKLDRNLITNYSMEDNQVVGVALQPGNRVAFIALRDPVGPFVPRTLTFNGVADRFGQTVAGQSVAIEATIQDPAAVVSGSVLNADGSALTGAEVRLFHQIQVPDEDGNCNPSWYGVSDKYVLGSAAHYAFDYVLSGTNKVIALDPNNDDLRELLFSAARNSQRLNVDVVMLGRGTLRGKALAEDGATPLANASIRVTSLTDNSQYGYTTDASGVFVFAKVPVGNFLVEGVHLPSNAQVVQSGYMSQAGGMVEMNLVLMSEEVRKVIVTYASMSGHVLNYDGATPAPGVPVYAFYQNGSQPNLRCPAPPDEEPPPECAVGATKTDQTGSYAFPEIPAGSYRVYTFNQAAYQEGTAWATTAPDAPASVNILLSGGFGTVRGIVKDAAGNPVSGAQVGGGMTLTSTDENGNFTLNDVPVGARTLVAVSQKLGAKGEALIDISTPGLTYPATIVLAAQGGIFGTVRTSDGSPVGQLDVYLIGTCNGKPCVVNSSTTNASGAYLFPSVPVVNEEYKVSAFLSDLSDGNVAAVKVLFAGQQLRADVTFKGSATVKGGIFNDNGNTPLAGRVGISALRLLSATGPTGKKIGLGFEFTQYVQIVDTTIENNQFTFTRVPVGPFIVTAAGAFSPEPVTFAGELTRAGETRVVNLNLNPTSVVSGTVFGPDGATPVANAVVRFSSDEQRTICTDPDPMAADAGDTEPTCTVIPQGIQALDGVTDAQGKFTFPLVNAGKFTVSVEERDQSGNPTGRSGSITSTVSPGKTTELSFRLMARAPVKITVYTHGGSTTVANATVKVEETGRIGENARPSYKADQNGQLILSGSDAVNEGSFTVFAQDQNGFAGRAAGRVLTDGAQVEVKVYLFDNTVTVQGVVYRQDGLTPVKNAEVYIANNDGDLAFTLTDANGRYSQDYIPLGPFRVGVFEAATGRRGFATGTAYATTPQVNVNVSEMPIGLVKGTVYAAGDLTPLSRWIVTLTQSYPSGRGLRLQGTTGADGKFSFPGVAAGAFTVYAAREGQSSLAASGNLSSEGEVIDIPLLANLTQPQAGSVVGWVYAADGEPAANALVCTGWNCSIVTTADRDGKFSFDNLSIGSYAVYAKNQVQSELGVGYGTIPYAGGSAYVKVVLQGLGTVSGTVVDGNVAVPGAQVTLTKEPDAGCGAPSCVAYADASGAFSFANVPAGPLMVVAKDPVNPQKTGSAGGTLNPAGTLNLTVAFADTALLKLKVLHADGTLASGVIGKLLGAEEFTLYRQSDQDGLLSFAAVPKGSYQLTLQDPAGQGLAKKSLQIADDLDLTGSPLILDEAPPAVASATPMAGEIKVPLNSKMVIVFSEPVQPGSVDNASVTLTTLEGTVDGFVALDAGGTVATFTPLTPLKDNHQYTVTVKGVTDLVDRPMAKDYFASFTTVDITAPVVASLSPDPAHPSGFPVAGVIRILFNKPFDPSAFAAPAITLTGPAGAVEGTVDFILGNTGVVFTPKYPLAMGSSYNVVILPATDLSGNVQGAGENFTITTATLTPPKMSGLTVSKNGQTVATVIENDTVDVTPAFAVNTDVAMVDWYLNGNPVQTTRAAPFTFSFQAIASLGRPGAQIRVSAIATDTSGNRGSESDGAGALVTVTADQPPAVSVSVSDPANATVVGNCVRVTVQVAASDDLGITKVGYQAVGGLGLSDCQPQAGIPPAVGSVDFGTPQKNPPASAFSFYVPRSAAPGSTITVNATAVDTKGGSVNATPLTLTVLDTTPPAVSFAGLSSGSAVKPGQTIAAVVSASDQGGISRLVFKANGVTVEDRNIAPPMASTAATFTWTVPASYTVRDQVLLAAIAYDFAGNSAEAPAVLLPMADTTAPQVAIRTATGADVMYPGAPLTLIVSAQDDAMVSSVAITGSGAFTFTDGAAFAPSSGVEKSFTVNVPAGLGDGAQLTVTATATDAASNVSAPATLTLTASTLQTVQLPASQLLSAGESVSVAATLSQPAPADGLTVTLVASGSIQVYPTTLTFAAGESVKSFTLSGSAGGSAGVAARLSGVTVAAMTVTVQGGIVTGKVVNALFEPVSGAEVVVNGTTVSTKADGTFSVTGIAGPKVTITAYDSVNKLQGLFSGTMNQLNGFLKNVTVAVAKSGSINGTVLLANGSRVGEGVKVELFAAGSTTALDTVFTDATGTFSMPQVRLGAYTLVASNEAGNKGRSPVTLSAEGQEVPAQVTFLGRGTINGVVRDASGVAVSGLTVTLSNTHIFGTDSATAVSGPSGEFTFANVTVGSFSLSTVDGISGYGAGSSGAVTSEGQQVAVTLLLSAFGSIEGHVYRFDGTTPAAGVKVRVGGLATDTDEGGFYRFTVLPLGVSAISVDDETTRSKAAVSALVSRHQETVTRDVVLSGSASVAVSIVDTSQNPVAGAEVTVSDGYGQLSATADVDGTTVFSHVFAGRFTVKGKKGPLFGSVTTEVADGAQLPVTVTAQAAPSATISGVVLAPDGATPAGGMRVSLTGGAQASGTSDGDGSFTFAALPLGSYTLYAYDANNRLRAKSATLTLTADGQVQQATLTMVGVGSVSGRVLMPNSAAGAADMPVTVRSLNPDFGNTTTVWTNAAGYYLAENLALGTIVINAGSIAQQLLAETSGVLDNDGDTLVLDLILQNNAVTMPVGGIYDANGNSFSVAGDGAATSGIFYRAPALDIIKDGSSYPFPAQNYGTRELLGRSIALRGTEVAGLTVTRKVFVPKDGYFARYLEVLQNPGAADITVDLKLTSEMTRSSYASTTLVATSSGDGAVQIAGQPGDDLWAVLGNGSNYPYGAFVWGGSAASRPASAGSYQAGNGTSGAFLTERWGSVTVPAGQKVALMHFVVLQSTQGGAQASVTRLTQLPPEALAGLSQDELAAIVNFAVPVDGSSTLAALPALNGKVTVNLTEADGDPLPGGVTVAFASSSPLFAMSHSTGANSSSVVFDAGAGNTFPIPLTPFTVTVTRTLSGGVQASQTFAGEFSAGSSEAVVNAALTGLGELSGKALWFDGTPVGSGTVSLVSGSTVVLSASLDASGSYTFRVLPPGSYSLQLSVALPGEGTALATQQWVSIAPGPSTTRDLTLPQYGSVTGTVLNWDGSAVAGSQVTVTGSSFTRSATTDGTGAFTLRYVPAGLYQLRTTDPATLASYTAQVAVAAGGGSTQNIQFEHNGINLPQNLVDGDLKQWDIQPDGSVRTGTNSLFYQYTGNATGGAALQLVAGNVIYPFSGAATGTTEQGGRELVTRQNDLAGLNVMRKVYIPREGYFARYLEILENPGSEPVTVTVNVASNFYSYRDFAVSTTSSGDAAISVAGQSGDDRWASLYDSSSTSTPRAAFVWSGNDAATPASAVTFTPRQNSSSSAASLVASWQQVTLAAGERAAFMHFVVQNDTGNGAAEGAGRLVQLPPEALEGLSAEEVGAIRNFKVPADLSSSLTPLSPVTGTVTVNLKDALGAPVLMQQNINVTVQSGSTIFNKSFSGSNQSCTGGYWNYTCTYNPQVTFTSNLSTSSPTVGIPLGAYTATGSLTVGGTTITQSAGGDFAAGSSGSTVDLVFTGSGNVTGRAQFANGAPANSGTVTLLNATGTSTIANTSVANGAYTLQLIPAGSFIAKLCVPYGNQSPNCVSAPVTVTTGQATSANLTLPALGSIGGALSAWNGNPVTGTYVYLTGKDTMSWFSASLYTYDGNYSFSSIQPGSYDITVTDPSSGVQKKGTVTMVNGEAIQQDISFQKGGRVQLTAQYADGNTVSASGQLDVWEEPGETAALTQSSYYAGNSSNAFGSNAANLKVRFSLPCNQPNGGTAFTSTGETTIAGFDGSGTTLPATVKLEVNYGTVVLIPLGTNGQPQTGTSLLMQIVDPADSSKVWGSCYTSSYGQCTIYNLYAGSAGFKARATLNGTVMAEGAAQLTGSNVSTTVRLQLTSDPVSFTKYLYDGNGNSYDVHKDGALYYGQNYIFEQDYSSYPGAMALSLASGGTSVAFAGPSNGIGVSEDGGRELITSQDNVMSGLSVSRKVYIPANGYFARYLDIFTNPGNSDVTVDLTSTSKFYYYDSYNDYDFAVRASSDPAIADGTGIDRTLTGTVWATVGAKPSENMPSVAFVWADDPVRGPTAATFAKYLNYLEPATVRDTFTQVTVPAGRSVALMHFLVQQKTGEAAVASAKRLAQLPPEAMAGMSPAERQMVVNFAVPADGIGTVTALPLLDGSRVSGSVRDYAGALPTSPSNEAYVTLKSSVPYYPNSYTAYTDSSGNFSFTSNSYEGSSRRIIPRAPFTLSASYRDGGFTLDSGAVAGSFAEGEQTAVQDIGFGQSGTIVATLTDFSGNPVAGATLTASTTQGTTQRFAAGEAGVYSRNFFPAGTYTVKAVVPAPGPSSGTALSTTTYATVVAGQQNPVTITLPQLSSIGGTVKDYNGNAVASDYVTITSTTNQNFSRSLYTYTGSNGGPTGTFTFAGLPADTYLVGVRDNYTYIYYYFTVTVAAGEPVSREFRYTMSGTVTGKVSYKTALPGYYPRYVNMSIVDPASGKTIATTSSDYSTDAFTFSNVAAPTDAATSYTLRASFGYNNKTATVEKTLPPFTANGQVLDVGTLALPLESGSVRVKLQDVNGAAFTKEVNVVLLDADGSSISNIYVSGGDYTFTNVYTAAAAITARVTYSGASFDIPVTMVANGTATVPITIPYFDGTLSGTLYAADGATPIGGAQYSLYRADGSRIACSSYRTYYGYLYYYYSCYTSGDGSYSTEPFVTKAGEPLKMTVQRWDFDPVDYSFTYPAGTVTGSVSPKLPLFAAKGAVKDSAGTGAPNASVTMTVTAPDNSSVRTYSATTDSSGNFVVVGSATGTYAITAQSEMGGSGSTLTGVITDLSAPLTGLDITLEATGTISGTVTRSGAAMADVTVLISLPERDYSRSFYTDASGSFTVTGVPLTAFTAVAVTYDNNENEIYSNTVSGALTAETPAANVELLFTLAPGTVYGIMKDTSGTPQSWEWVTVTRVSDGSAIYSQTDASGFFALSNMPQDGYLALGMKTVGEGDVAEEMSAYGILRDGESLKLDLDLRPAARFGTRELVSESDPYRYLIGSGGTVAGGGDTAESLATPFTSGFYALSERQSSTTFDVTRGWFDGNGQLVMEPFVMNGKVYSRKVYRPAAGGYLRYLEVVDNPSTTDAALEPAISGAFNKPAANSSWSYAVDPSAFNSYAIATPAGDVAMPQVGMVMQGVGGADAPVQIESASAEAPLWYWNGTAPAGGRFCLLHFLFQADPGNDNAAASRARALGALDAAALEQLGGVDTAPLYGLTAEEKSCIRNFPIPAEP